MTWNLHGAKRPDLAVVARVLADSDPDVVALQEVRRSQAEVLADLLGVDDWHWLAKHRPPFLPGPFGLRWTEGLAVLSHFPVAARSSAVLTRAVPAYSFRRRVMQEVVVTTAAGPVRIVNVHLSSDDDDARAAQADRAIRLLAVDGPHSDLTRTVVLGDLNTVDADDVVGRFAAEGLVDAWSAADRREGDGATNPAAAPTQRLDHVLAGVAFAVAEARVIGTPEAASSSDHLPLVADLVVA